jgi:putative FmdB family regulatory protein
MADKKAQRRKGGRLQIAEGSIGERRRAAVTGLGSPPANRPDFFASLRLCVFAPLRLCVFPLELAMPIYEFACPKCRKIYSFLSKRLRPERPPVCPKCGGKRMERQMSAFAMPRGAKKEAPASTENPPESGPDFDDPRLQRAMGEIEADMAHLDENNPKHLAVMMRKMKDIMPAGTMPKEMETAIKRLEAGEDPEKIEEDMGPLLGEDMEGMEGPGGGGGGSYSRDAGLYDY